MWHQAFQTFFCHLELRWICWDSFLVVQSTIPRHCTTTRLRLSQKTGSTAKDHLQSIEIVHSQETQSVQPGTLTANSLKWITFMIVSSRQLSSHTSRKNNNRVNSFSFWRYVSKRTWTLNDVFTEQDFAFSAQCFYPHLSTSILRKIDDRARLSAPKHCRRPNYSILNQKSWKLPGGSL